MNNIDIIIKELIFASNRYYGYVTCYTSDDYMIDSIQNAIIAAQNIKSHPFGLFSSRLQLSERADEWIDQNNVTRDTLGVISALSAIIREDNKDEH